MLPAKEKLRKTNDTILLKPPKKYFKQNIRGLQFY